MGGCIVCGVDDSIAAREALPIAARLSDGLGLRLVFVHVGQLWPATDAGARAGGSCRK